MSEHGDAVAASAASPTLPVGHVVSGKYAIVRRIAQGGMGTVYEAENLSIGRRVALKVLAPSFARHPEALERFHREARVAARIGHPNILDVFDMGVSEAGIPYIVMELLNGCDLGRIIGTAPMGRGLSVDIVLQLCGALGAAHSVGIVHRDLKPENVFLARRGGLHPGALGVQPRSSPRPPRFVVKVIDFGIARFLGRADGEAGRRITSSGVVLGTAAYMSPEQARGEGGIDHRSDIYSAGVILYEMLSGRAPYRGSNNAAVLRAIEAGDPPRLSTAAPWVKEDLAAVVGRAMAREPRERFQTARDLSVALAPFASSMDVPPSPPELVSPRWTPDPGAATTRRDPTRPDPASSVSKRGGGRLRWLALLAIWVGMWLAGFLAWQKLGGSDEVRRAPPATLSLRVTGDATDARVLLDGRLLGRLPVAVEVPPAPGAHVLRVEAKGHPATEQTIALERPLHVIVNMPPGP